MKKEISYTILTVITAICSAQINYVRLDQIQGVPMTITYNLDEENDIDGSRYYQDEWDEIRVEKVGGLNILIPEGKYDILLDEIIVKQNEAAYLLERKQEVVEFFLQNKRFIGSSYANGNFGFFEVLYEGENVILFKKKVCLIQKGKPSNGITAGVPDKYVLSQDFFIKRQDENNDALKLKVTKRKIILKSNKYLALSDFLEKNKIGYDSDAQLIEAFKDFDTSF